MSKEFDELQKLVDSVRELLDMAGKQIDELPDERISGAFTVKLSPEFKDGKWVYGTIL